MKSNAPARAPQQKQQVKTYLTQMVTVFEYNAVTRENKPQGQFTLTVQSANNVNTFIIQRQGCAAPLVSFQLSRQINWTLQNNVYVYITDARKAKWLLQFPDAATAAQATALICLLVAVTSGKDVTRYEAQQLVQGKAISEGDIVRMSYWVCTFQPWPFIQNVLASKEDFTTPLTSNNLPTGLVTGMSGMVAGNSRAIFVPRTMTALGNGQRDPGFPERNLVVVVNLLSAEFVERKEVPAPAPAPAPVPVAVPVPEPQVQQPVQPVVQVQQQASPVRRTSLTSAVPDIDDIGVISLEDVKGAREKSETEPERDAEPVAEPEPVPNLQPEEDDMDPEEAERLRKMDKIRRLGGIAGAFAMPMPPARTRRTSETTESAKTRRPSETADITRVRRDSKEEPVLPKVAASQYPAMDRMYQAPVDLSSVIAAPSVVQAVKKPVLGSDPNKSPLENRIDVLESTIGAKLDSVTGAGTDAGSVVSGVTTLVAFVKNKQMEIERLRAEIEKERSAPSHQISVQSLDTVKKESEKIQKSNMDLERGLAQVEAKVRDMESALRSSREAAIGREKTLMKKLMGSVFEDVQNVFEERKLYSGAQVGQMLKKLMREQSFNILTDIDENGLF